MKEPIEVINYYELKPDPVRGVHILDTRDGKVWYFGGGYGDIARRITQPGCAKVIAALGDRRVTANSIIGVLDAIADGTPIDGEAVDRDASLRAQLATAHEAIGAAIALLHEIDAGGQYPHSGIMIGVVLRQLEGALK